MAKRAKAERDGIFVRIVCAVTAIILASGIVTIGVMNLVCTDELYISYTAEFTTASIGMGIAVFIVTALLIVGLYNLLRVRRAVTAVLVLAFLARLCAALFWKIEPESDFKITYELGKLLADTPVMQWGAALDDYGTTYNSVWAAHLPFVVYQSILLKITENTVILKLANALFSFGACVFTVKTAHRLGGERAMRAALTFMAFNPTIVFFVPVLTNQHISQFFLVLGIWMFFCIRVESVQIRAMLAGLCAGISQLMRPELWVVVIAVAVYVTYSVFRDGEAVKKLTSFAAGLCIFLSVTEAMNTFLVSAEAIHGSIYSSNLNYKILVGLNPETNGSWSAADSGLEGNDRAINTLIISRLKENPLKLLPRLYGKSAYQLGTYVYTWSYRDESEWISQNVMRRCTSALMIVVCALASWNMIRRRRKELVWIYITLCGYAMTYAVIEVQSRYNFIFIPMLVICACVGGGE